MKPLILSIAAASFVATPAFAQSQRLLSAQSEIAFTSRQMGVPVEGRFRRFDAQIAFDPKRPQAAKIDFQVDLGSASLGAAEAEAELAKPLWFNVAQFPQARFSSTAVKPLGAGTFEVAGKLTIKSHTRDIVVPVTLAQNGATTTARGSFTLKRLDFRIGENEWADTSMVANEVQVRLKLALSGMSAP